MASLNSLPAELVEKVVELSLPHDDTENWAERSDMLRALCLTCKTTLWPARRLLYRHLLVSSSESGRQLAGTLLATSFMKPGHVQRLEVVNDPNVPDYGWEEEVGETGSSALPILLKMAVAQEVTLEAVGTLQGAALEQAFQVNYAHRLLCPRTLPNLTTLCIIEVQAGNVCNSATHTYPGDDEVLELYTPLFETIKAISTTLNLPSPARATFVVLDVFLNGNLVPVLGTLPATLAVLRLCSDMHDDGAQYLPSLLNALDAPTFRPTLKELHLTWCESKDVVLVIDDDVLTFRTVDAAFWRFLDGVRDRLRLDV
ncbi:hypothetical protein JCM10207_008596 [Rhodosporidiobolus poonsookiae]